jgi:phosphopantetheinyl transferase
MADSEWAVWQTLSDLQRKDQIMKLWAAKESAYKAIKRIAPATRFLPKTFRWEADQHSVVFQDYRFSISFIEDDYFLAATCHHPDQEPPWTWIEAIPAGTPDEERAATYQVARRFVADLYNLQPNTLSISKDSAGIPQITGHSALRGLILSLSHDNGYAAIGVGRSDTNSAAATTSRS